MNRNPNGMLPRQMRDCTFQDWADPIERPAPKQSGVVTVYVTLLCIAAVMAVILMEFV